MQGRMLDAKTVLMMQQGSYYLLSAASYNTAVTMCTTFNIQEFCILPEHCIHVFHVILTTNNDHIPKQH
jgi:hypothetical protein